MSSGGRSGVIFVNLCENENCIGREEPEFEIAAVAHCEDCRNFLCGACEEACERVVVTVEDNFLGGRDSVDFLVPVCDECVEKRKHQRLDERRERQRIDELTREIADSEKAYLALCDEERALRQMRSRVEYGLAAEKRKLERLKQQQNQRRQRRRLFKETSRPSSPEQAI
jgi:ferredoxin